MNKATVTLRITTIISVRYGGCIFSGSFIDKTTGLVTDATAYAVVKAGAKRLAGHIPQVGMWVEVEGSYVEENRDHNGFMRKAMVVSAERVEFLRPAGEHLIRFLADSDEFRGVGTARARALWNLHGEVLYEILDGGQWELLTGVIPDDVALNLVRAWEAIGNTEVVQWLQALDVNLALARKIVRHFTKQTKAKIEEDPYRLLSFSASWKETDAFARQKLAVAMDDPRRLQAACEEALYRAFAEGHTMLSLKELTTYTRRLLVDTESMALVDAVIAQGETNGSYLVADGHYQSIGAAALERTVAKAIADRVASSLGPVLHIDSIRAIIDRFEAAEGVSLSSEQRKAIELAASHGLVCISGGAGVGKTTVLKALLAVLDAAGVKTYLMALAGRAAKRMSEATGRPARTIASFIKHAAPDDLEGGLIVIDECSMVDIISMERIFNILPASCRVVLVGDPAQLMPVGPGLVFHALTGNALIPRVELKVARRFGLEIAEFANAIRGGEWPKVEVDLSRSVAFLPISSKSDIAAKVIELYGAEGAETQVLCAQRPGPVGTKELNLAIQAKYNPTGQALMVHDEQFDLPVNTGFRLGDLVICTKNNYLLDLRNGSLGRITEIPSDRPNYCNEDGEVIGTVIAWIEWDDGERRPLFEDMLDDLELGYAITIHKAQGSQWKRIIVPIQPTRSLDRSMLYTAVTRAQSKVILVGDPQAAKAAACGVPHSKRRNIGLASYVNAELNVVSEGAHHSLVC